jgi:HNH endonuclease
METSANRRKSQFLGMPHGTAANSLRKKLLFKLVVEAGKNRCYQCHKKIETVEEFTIEHKKPWLGVSRELFWDLNNIAFSHSHCNRPREGWGDCLRKVGPPGTAWCGKHQKFLPVAQFDKHAKNWNGVQRYCKECKRQTRKRRVVGRVGFEPTMLP